MNNIALVTGASRGLGKSMALHLADKGCDIILTYLNNRDQADSVIKEIQKKGQRAVALQLDVIKPDTFTGFVDRVKVTLREVWQRENLDFLVNNAGFGVFKEFIETTEEDFDLMMDAHVKAPFFLTQKLLPYINDGGRIVNISSGLTRFTFPGYIAYASMKTALETMTRYLAKELGHRQIRVNVLAPGAIETDFSSGKVRDTKDLNDLIASNTALGRVGQPDDIGGVVATLLDENTGWINGQRIEVSGGQSI